MYIIHLNIMNYDNIKVEDLILDYFKERRTSDLAFVDYSVCDIIIKNILVSKDEIKQFFSYDDDTRLKIENQNLELVNVIDETENTCDENKNVFSSKSLSKNKHIWTLLANERVRLNNLLIDICNS